MATWYICYHHLIAYRIYFISMYIVQIGNNWFRITITVLIDTFYVCFQFGPTIHWYLLLIIATFSCVLRQILLRKTKSGLIAMTGSKKWMYLCMYFRASREFSFKSHKVIHSQLQLRKYELNILFLTTCKLKT